MRKFVLAAVLVLMASGAQAATLNVVGGILHGASGVDVGGALYDVELLYGTCPALYSGCDSTLDFTFWTSSAARSAAVALLEQVIILDPISGIDFATSPGLVAGCNLPDTCHHRIPYRAAPAVNSYYSRGGVFTPFSVTPVPPDVWFIHHSLASTGSNVPEGSPGYAHAHARWSPSAIPEPSTALLLGLGLTGLAAKGRRRS